MRVRSRKAFLIVAAAVFVLTPAALAGMIAFGTSDPPPPLTSIVDPFRAVDFSDVPKAEAIRMRDGAPLSVHVYRATPRNPERVVIAIHGSSAFGASMHPLAKALRDAGITVYAPDIRGHGASGRRGDIDYAAQLDDDLADLTTAIRAAHPNAKLTLLGFSSGGGFALHSAATPTGKQFDRAILISPMLGPRAPTIRPEAYTWARPFIPRIIGLTILDRIGVHTFENLPALAFAVPADKEAASRLAGIYSFRMLMAFGTKDYAADLRNAQCALAVIVGGADELFAGDRFPATIRAERTDVSVNVIPGLGHAAMVIDRRAFDAIIAAIQN